MNTAARSVRSCSLMGFAALMVLAGSTGASLAASADDPLPGPVKRKMTSDQVETPYPIFPQKAIEGIGPAGEITRAATGMKAIDGSASDSKGNVYFADRQADKVYRLDAESGKSEVFLDSIDSPAGLTMLDDDTLVVVQSSPHVVTKVDVKTHATTPIVEAFADKDDKAGQLVRPNDLAVDAVGGMYISDTGGQPPTFGEMPPNAGVYYISKNASGATLKMKIIEDLKSPAGLALSADGKTLYVLPTGESAAFAYDVTGPGKVAGKREFCTLMGSDGKTGVRGGDGMTIDEKGNLYMALPNGLTVQVVSPEGKILGHIRFSEKVFAVGFGGKDHKTLYVSGLKTLYAVPMEIAGRGADKK